MHTDTIQNKIRAWFDAALDIPKANRADWLEKNCVDPLLRQRVGELIAAHELADEPISQPVGEWFLALEDDASEPIEDRADHLIGKTIAGFELLRHLGSGGMSSVYLGQRSEADFEQQVAVKVLKHNIYSATEQRMFRRERQLLAELEHPNIARFIDGGVSDSALPYIIMEYVDGEPITRHCNGLDLPYPDRVKLFLSVCRATDYAHRALIVHRDIKPANVLVSHAGVVKLLDFGIAKLINPDEASTLTARVYLTPEYAAPEQFLKTGDSTAVDVYALGVLLHELLIGIRPDRGARTKPSHLAAQQATTDKITQVKTKSLQRYLRGDLDNIIERATQDDPSMRYRNAGELADDIERFIQGQPVEAHPPSTWYRTKKFIHRHRGAVGVSFALVLALLASLGLALWQAMVAQQQSQLAQAQANFAKQQTVRAEIVRDYLLDLLRTTAADLPASEKPTAEQIARKASSELAANTSLSQDVKLDLLLTFADISLSQRDFIAADRYLHLATKWQTLGDQQSRIRWLRLSANSLMTNGKAKQAAELLRPNLAELRAANEQVAAQALQTLAYCEWDLGNIELARELHIQASEKLNLLLGLDHPLSLGAALAVGGQYSAAQLWKEADQVFAPALVRWVTLQMPQSEEFANALVQHGYALQGLGHVEQARQKMQRALDLRRQIYVKPHDRLANSLSALGSLELDLGNYEASAQLREESLKIRLKKFAEAHPLVIITRLQVMATQLAMNRLDNAKRVFDPAWAQCQAQQFAHPYCVTALQLLLRWQTDNGELLAAEQTAKQALDVALRIYGPDSPDIGRVHLSTGQLYALQARSNLATQAFDSALKNLGSSTSAGRKAQIVRVLSLAPSMDKQQRKRECDALLNDLDHPILDPHHLAKLLIMRIEVADAAETQRLREKLRATRAAFLDATWKTRRARALAE